MTDNEKYLFDLNGYLVVPGILSPEELAQANQAIDRHQDQTVYQPPEHKLAGDSPALAGRRGRGTLGDVLEWDEPWCLPFRRMLAHPRLVPYLNALLGRGFRMDHPMFCLTMDQGTEGFYFHGSAGPDFSPEEYYVYRNGRMYCGLSVCAIQLTDVNPGDGGFAVIPGSHKANFPLPPKLRLYQAHQDQVRQVTCQAGDAILFTEALSHGTLPWRGEQPRRSVLTRYHRGNMAYVPAPPVPPWAGPRERAVLQPPSNTTRLGRPELDA